MKRIVKILAKDHRDTIRITAELTCDGGLSKDEVAAATRDCADKLLLMIPTVKTMGIALSRARCLNLSS